MKIVFTGGGTAGHVMPNIALINALNPTDTVWYFGGDGIEKTLINQKTKNVNYFMFKAPKLIRKLTPSNLLLPFNLCKSTNTCLKQLKKTKPDIVFAKGGYVSLPVVWAAKVLKIPVLCHESDVTVGLANKLCAKTSLRLLTTFETTQIKNSAQVGCPIRQEIYSADKTAGLSTMGFEGKKPIMMFLGGSLGAQQLNNLAIKTYDRLKRRFDVFVVTGKNKQLDNHPSGLHYAEFLDNIYDCLKACCICVTRGGGNTLCELTALNIPFLAIPLTANSRGEQSQNAKYFASKGCGINLAPDVSPDTLVQKINLLYSKAPLFKQAQRALKIDGTADILKLIYSYAN